jgi:hypothetical protein
MLWRNSFELAHTARTSFLSIDCKSAAKNLHKKTSQQVSKSAQISDDNLAENIQKA